MDVTQEESWVVLTTFAADEDEVSPFRLREDFSALDEQSLTSDSSSVIRSTTPFLIPLSKAFPNATLSQEALFQEDLLEKKERALDRMVEW